MAINFIVEDGSIIDNANSFITVEEFKQYWENRGVDYLELTDSAIQPLLIQATEYIDSLNYKGTIYSESQPLQWPRIDVYNNKGRYIDYNEIPAELKAAVCEVAKKIKESGPIENLANNVKSESMGPVSVTYRGVNSIEYAIKKAYALIRPLLKSVEVIRS